MHDILKDFGAYLRAMQLEDSAELAGISAHSCRFVRARAAANQHATPEDLTVLSNDLDPAVRMSVAGNPSAETRTLYLLEERALRGAKEDRGLRQELAWSRRTDTPTLRQLVAFNEWEVMLGAVNNIGCPKDLLEAFFLLPKIPYVDGQKVRDKNEEIREIARKRLGLPTEEEQTAK